MADDIQFRDGNSQPVILRYIDVNGVKVPGSFIATAPYICDKFTSLAVTATTGGVALSSVAGGIPAASTNLFLYVPTGSGNILYTEDGTTAPTSSMGILIPAGDVAEIAVKPLANVKFISSAGTVNVVLSFRHYGAT